MMFSVSIRSGAVSISVPSRSNTMVGERMANRYRGCADEASRRSAGGCARQFLFSKPCRGAPWPLWADVRFARKPASNRLPMSAEIYKREAAAGALEFVEPGMRLGLGTGSTARPFVELLGDRVRAGIDVIAVPTSE